VAMSSLALALLGFLVWGHHLFVSGMSEYAAMVFSALTFLVAIPSGVKVFNWVATLYKGSIRLESPMLYALTFIFLFTIGGLTGLFLGMLAIDVHLHDTYFVVAHFHYVMVGGTVMGFVGGLHYWWPKITGKLYDEVWAKICWFFVFIGFNVTFIAQFIMGSRGMPRRYYDYLPEFEIFHEQSSPLMTAPPRPQLYETNNTLKSFLSSKEIFEIIRLPVSGETTLALLLETWKRYLSFFDSLELSTSIYGVSVNLQESLFVAITGYKDLSVS